MIVIAHFVRYRPRNHTLVFVRVAFFEVVLIVHIDADVDFDFAVFQVNFFLCRSLVEVNM
jgi:hypothetical protein